MLMLERAAEVGSTADLSECTNWDFCLPLPAPKSIHFSATVTQAVTSGLATIANVIFHPVNCRKTKKKRHKKTYFFIFDVIHTIPPLVLGFFFLSFLQQPFHCDSKYLAFCFKFRLASTLVNSWLRDFLHNSLLYKEMLIWIYWIDCLIDSIIDIIDSLIWI